MVNLKRCLLSVVVLAVVASGFAMPTPASADDLRVIGTSEFVVFLKDDFSLEYYEVIDSEGFFVGFTPPGWRNDRLGRQQIDVATRPEDGARAELWHLTGDIYYVEIYRAGGGLLGTGSFSAAGVPGGQANFATTPPDQTNTGNTGNTTTTSGTGTTVTVTTTVTIDSLNASHVYIVQYGDTLAKIAARFNVSLSSLVAANHITNINLIFVGQSLLIP